MSARRIAVLVGSQDPAYFARYTRPDWPGEAAVPTALRAHARRAKPATANPFRRSRRVPVGALPGTLALVQTRDARVCPTQAPSRA